MDIPAYIFVPVLQQQDCAEETPPLVEPAGIDDKNARIESSSGRAGGSDCDLSPQHPSKEVLVSKDD